MLKIYFDDVLIDNDYYTYLDNDYKLFDDNTNFRLGATACNTFKLSVDKSVVSSHPNEVKIDDGTSTFYLIVDSIEEDKFTYTYTLVDKLINFNFNYDASGIINSKHENEEVCYLSDIWKDMCNQAGVEYDDEYEFINDIEVEWYDNTIQARKYLSYIAELQGGYACINEDGKLTIKPHKKASSKTIDIDECSDFILGEKKTITRVVYDTGTIFWAFGDDTGTTLYLDTTNVFITSEEVVENIYNSIVGFEFYLVDVPQSPMDSNIRAGDIITFTDGSNEYPTIAQYSMSFGGAWIGGYELKVNTDKQEETKIKGDKEKILKIESEIDRTNATLSIVAEQKVDKDSIISSINLSPEEISIQSSKIKLEGYTSINNAFSIDEYGNAKIGGMVNSGKYNILPNSSGLFNFDNWTISNSYGGTPTHGVKIYKDNPDYYTILDSGSIFDILSNAFTGDEYMISDEIVVEASTEYALSMKERAYPAGDYYGMDFSPNDYYVQIIESFSDTFSSDKTTTIFNYDDLLSDTFQSVFNTFTTDSQTVKLKIKFVSSATGAYHILTNAIFQFGDILLDKNNVQRDWTTTATEEDFGGMDLTRSRLKIYDNDNVNVLVDISKGGINVDNDVNAGGNITQSGNNVLDTSDIVDNLTSTDTDKPLSANQGKILNNKIIDNTHYAYSPTTVVGTLAKNGWRTVFNTYTTDSLPAGTYLFIVSDVYSCTATTTQILTSRMLIDGDAGLVAERVSTTIGFSLYTNTQSLRVVTFETSGTHTVDMTAYSSYDFTSIAHEIDIIRLS